MDHKHAIGRTVGHVLDRRDIFRCVNPKCLYHTVNQVNWFYSIEALRRAYDGEPNYPSGADQTARGYTTA